MTYLEQQLEFESTHYHDAYLDRRITSRMRRTDADSYDDYQMVLEQDPAERTALLDALSINVTRFFRNPGVWGTIRSVLRSLSADRQLVRVWSAPCSDGREPFSVAMLALDDPAIDADRVRITATDINADVISRARRAAYRTTHTTDIEKELEPLDSVGSYVETDGPTVHLTDTVRSMVTFRQHDLIRDDPPGTFDLVLCRNLLIYIDAEYKAPIFETLIDSLTADGFLVIGMTETLPGTVRNRFEPVDKSHRIYRLQ